MTLIEKYKLTLLFETPTFLRAYFAGKAEPADIEEFAPDHYRSRKKFPRDLDKTSSIVLVNPS